MTREQLEHVTRAAARIADATEIVVVGSKALLGEFPAAPAELLESMEADVYPRDHPERADLIDGAIGELSPFHETHGCVGFRVERDRRAQIDAVMIR